MGPVVRALSFHCQGPSSIRGHGTKIPEAAQHGQKKQEKQRNSWLPKGIEGKEG